MGTVPQICRSPDELRGLGSIDFREMIDALPTAIYTTDAQGKLIHFNPSCISFSGRVPTLGSDSWCVTWKLYHADGTPMPHDQCPMAITLRERRAIRGVEAIAERPDGTRVWFEPFPTPLFDETGTLIGGINMLVDITERKRGEFLLRSQKTALELPARGKPINDVLEFLVASVEEHSGGRLTASIAMLNENETEFVESIGRKLPESYHQAVRGLPVASDIGSCCRAVLERQSVIIPDVTTDPQWARFAQFLVPLGYRSAWSSLITGSGGKILGTIAVYTSRPQEPTEADRWFVESVTRAAALSIERKHADDGLRAGEQRYRQLVSLLPAAVYSCDRSGLITYFNEQAARLWGRSPRVGDTDERFCGSEQMILPDGTALPHEQCPMAVALREARSFRDQEVNIRRPDGSIVAVMVNIDPVRDEQGRVVGAINAFHDITAIKRAEQAVRESEERYRSLVSVITDVPWTTDPTGAFTTDQPAWSAYTGQDQEQLRGFGWVQMLHPEDREQILKIWNQACQAKSLYEATGRLWHAATRQYRHFVVRATPVLNADGSVREWVGSCTDDHDSKLSEQQLLSAKQEAEEASQAKDKFLAMLSHELRTPLTPVLMTTAALERREDLAPELRDDVAMIRRNVELQSKLIDDLLDLSRIKSGKLRLSFEPLGINDLVRHACETCRASLRQKGIRLHCDLDEGAFDVVGDSARLQQVFWNLLSNAAKFTPDGGQVYIRTESVRCGDPDDRQVRVTVRDTGRGIEPETIGSIFDAFEQGDTGITRQFGGLGLGLAICSALVEQHRGTITAHSDGKDKGATFVVELPGLPQRSNDGADGQAPASSREALRALRLLIVEDHPDTADVLAELLSASGHDVKTANNGADAIKAVRECDFDIVVSDLGLPDMTGYDLMHQIKQINGTKGIAMSGFGMEEDIRRSEQAGFSDHLVKPATIEALEHSIRRVLAKDNHQAAGRV